MFYGKVIVAFLVVRHVSEHCCINNIYLQIMLLTLIFLSVLLHYIYVVKNQLLFKTDNTLLLFEYISITANLRDFFFLKHHLICSNFILYSLKIFYGKLKTKYLNCFVNNWNILNSCWIKLEFTLISESKFVLRCYILLRVLMGAIEDVE